MTFTNSISICLSKYIQFEGRASKSEFWWFYVFAVTLQTISFLFLLSSNELSYISIITILSLSLPLLAVGSRRLHDVGKSGWWQLLMIAGILGIILIFWWVSDGESTENQYGVGNDSKKIAVDDNQFNVNRRSVNVMEQNKDKKYIFNEEEKNLNNDAYQIYLVEKYEIKRNDVLSKFVLNNRLYRNIDDVLNAAQILDSSKKIEIEEFRPNSNMSQKFRSKSRLGTAIDNDLQKINSEEMVHALNYLTINKFSVIKKTHYRIPRLQYIISKNNVTEIKFSDIEFLNFVEKLKKIKS